MAPSFPSGSPAHPHQTWHTATPSSPPVPLRLKSTPPLSAGLWAGCQSGGEACQDACTEAVTVCSLVMRPWCNWAGMKDLAGHQSPLGDHRTQQLSPLPSFQPPAQAWAEFLLVVSRWLGRQEVRCWEGVRCEGLGEERKLPGQGVLGMSDDPSPSSFLARGVRANLLPAGAPSSGPEMGV